MTESDLRIWKQSAKETLSEMDLDKRSRDTFILLGASLAILGHNAACEDISIRTHQEPRDAAYYAQDELHAADEYHKMGLDNIAGDELRHAQFFIDEMRAAADTTEKKNVVMDLQMQHDLIESNL